MEEYLVGFTNRLFDVKTSSLLEEIHYKIARRISSNVENYQFIDQNVKFGSGREQFYWTDSYSSTVEELNESYNVEKFLETNWHNIADHFLSSLVEKKLNRFWRMELPQGVNYAGWIAPVRLVIHYSIVRDCILTRFDVLVDKSE